MSLTRAFETGSGPSRSRAVKERKAGPAWRHIDEQKGKGPMTAKAAGGNMTRKGEGLINGKRRGLRCRTELPLPNRR